MDVIHHFVPVIIAITHVGDSSSSLLYRDKTTGDHIFHTTMALPWHVNLSLCQ